MKTESSSTPVRSRLTATQLSVLQAFEDLLAKNHYAPTIREVGLQVGLRSSSTVHNHVKTLVKRGFLKPSPGGPNRPRSLVSQVLPVRLETEAVRHLPFVGRVAAGLPATACENVEDDFEVPESFVRRPTSFMLKVRGDSMIDDGIVDGDVILVEPDGDTSDGRIVVALIADDATVKRIFRESGDRIRLQPAHPTMQPIYAHTSDVSVVGAVVGWFHSI